MKQCTTALSTHWWPLNTAVCRVPLKAISGHAQLPSQIDPRLIWGGRVMDGGDDDSKSRKSRSDLK